MKTVIKIENWSTCLTPGCGDLYTPPELITTSIQGNVFGHPRISNGKHTVTTAISKVSGRLVFTKSGSCYKLGKIDKKFRKYLRETKPNWDWRHPITIKPASKE